MMTRLTYHFFSALVLLLALPGRGWAQEPASPAVVRALSYLSSQRTQMGLTPEDVAAPLVTDAFTDAHNGVSHIYLRQRYQGLDVLGAEMSLHFNRQGELLQRSGTFVSHLASVVRNTAPTFTAVAATGTAARAVGLTPGRLREVAASRPGQATVKNQFLLRDEAISRVPIPVHLVLARQDDGQVLLAWDLELAPPRAANRWHAQVDATTGKVLRRTDRIIHERLAARAAAPTGAAARALTAGRGTTDDGAVYNVFPFPLEGPGFGPRALLTNPADAAASPFGWHDTNGQPGPEHTITRGNNVYAFVGRESRPVYSPDGTPSLRFDFPYNIQKAPLENRDAAITNLFYLNNVMHDVSFQYGFDELSGNFQTKNYTSQGRGKDAVLAVAQDPDGTSNAYFSPGADGDSSSMHMFLWPQPFTLRFDVTAPLTIAGSYPAVAGQLGPVWPVSPLTGRLVVVNDGSTMPTKACADNALLNSAALKGNIAVIDRGDCNFSVKILAAQAAGAVAVVMVNNVVGEPTVMGGDAADITIPALMISQASGNRIKAALAAGNPTTVTVQRLAPQEADRDGSFDNLIVAHEYTHGISTRLTGGASHNDCLPTDNGKDEDDPTYIPYETMGEGWSDFFGLWFTTKPGDNGATPRSVGTYVLAEPTSGVGLRLKPYSTDLTVNNATYALIGKPYTETHDIGEVWAAMLWDLNWAMIAQYGYDPDLYHGKGGNNKTMQLVMDGLKLQPCRPGFADGRDAILKADVADFGGANQALIWRVFARRGLGYDAVQGGITALDNKAGFAIPVAGPLTESTLELYPNPTPDVVRVRATSAGLGTTADIEIRVISMLGQTVYTSRLSGAQLLGGTSVNLRNVTSGIYLVRVQGPNGTVTRRLTVTH
jgi:extracellular elastinolytic metalloproteinase